MFPPSMVALDDGHIGCTSGCGLVFQAQDVNPEDLRFGFHVIVPSAYDGLDDPTYG